MSTNHTQNYNLCQWEASDRVLREDFNADNAKLETALTRIEATADRADAAAEKAYCPDSPGFVIGRFSGQSDKEISDWRSISLGFQPRAVLIWPENAGLIFTSTTSGNMTAYGAFVIRAATSDSITCGLKIVAEGFSVRNYSTTTTRIYKRLDNKGYTYCYIAFR